MERCTDRGTTEPSWSPVQRTSSPHDGRAAVDWRGIERVTADTEGRRRAAA